MTMPEPVRADGGWWMPGLDAQGAPTWRWAPDGATPYVPPPPTRIPKWPIWSMLGATVLVLAVALGSSGEDEPARDADGFPVAAATPEPDPPVEAAPPAEEPEVPAEDTVPVEVPAVEELAEPEPEPDLEGDAAQFLADNRPELTRLAFEMNWTKIPVAQRIEMCRTYRLLPKASIDAYMRGGPTLDRATIEELWREKCSY